MGVKELRLYGPTSNLGYGISKSDVAQALKWDPDVIFQQGTSSDPGPGYLGRNESYSDSLPVKEDLRVLLKAAVRSHIPAIVSAGGSGGNGPLEDVLKLVDAVAVEEGLRFRCAVIRSEVDKGLIEKKLRSGEKIRRLVEHPALSKYLGIEDLRASVRVVGQVSYEPIMKALGEDVEVVITGRACDIALPMAVPLRAGVDKGLAAQVGKIVECGGAACVRESLAAGVSTGVFAVLRGKHGLVRSLNRRMRCTVASVVSRGVLYERADAAIPEEMPDGHLDVTEAKYTQVDANTVRVEGGKFVPRREYLLKIEGAGHVGYRTICVCGVRDPYLVEKIATGAYLDQVKARVRQRMVGTPDADYRLNFRTYGVDGVMGSLEPMRETSPHEVGIVVDSVARTPELSKALCMVSRQQLLHHPYPGRKTTAGNVAFPFSPSDIYVGDVFEYNVWHLMPMTLAEVGEVFRPAVVDFPRGSA